MEFHGRQYTVPLCKKLNPLLSTACLFQLMKTDITETLFVLPNSADPADMPFYVAFHLGLQFSSIL